MEKKRGTVFGGSLLVAGTAIGGGMLALPVLTGLGGFFPASIMYIACWLFMAMSGLLLVEVFLWSPKEVNIVSMAQMTLGKTGKIVAWLLYLFLFYSLTVAYVSGGGGLVSELLPIPSWLGPLIFVLIFAPFVLIGPWAVDRINWVLMVGLGLSFALFLGMGFTKMEFKPLFYHNWPVAMLATPVVFTSFGFQGLIPTLTTYLDRDQYRVKQAVLIGSLIPLVIYIVWEALFLGIVPIKGLEAAKELGQGAVAPLKHILGATWLYGVGQFFAFFAIVTSFLGVTLGLLDFLADGLGIKKSMNGRAILSLIIFIPPTLFAMFNPCLFLNALHYAGGFGCALLLGLLPILMVWIGKKKFQSKYSFWTLGVMTIFIFFELTIMVAWK